MATLQLIRITRDGVETVLEEIPVPDSFDTATLLISPNHIKGLEKHYQKTGKPKRTFIDVLYITRNQVERHLKDGRVAFP